MVLARFSAASRAARPKRGFSGFLALQHDFASQQRCPCRACWFSRKEFVRASKKYRTAFAQGVAQPTQLPYRKSVTFQILGGAEMRYKLLTAALAATVALQFAGPAAATDLEVTH
ncbi:hypothetical protein EN993_32080, partial [Mesorhizobium sp. M7D.F.Ca.US.004.01.2.1]